MYEVTFTQQYHTTCTGKTKCGITDGDDNTWCNNVTNGLQDV
jgi:hypothetical protein